jgi:hypothetical protein
LESKIKNQPMLLKKIITAVLVIALAGILGCTDDPPEPTGTFNVLFSGDISEQLQGQAYFELLPRNTNGLIVVSLVQSESILLRLTFFNTDPVQIFLEPGTYTVVNQLDQNVTREVLVDYVTDQGTFNAASGELRVGIVKQSQIKGEVVDVRFNLLNSSCSGSFDAIPE